jgi:hypothetical protein
MTAACSIVAISRIRPPPLDVARGGPEQRRRAAPRAGKDVVAKRAPHQVGPLTAGTIGRPPGVWHLARPTGALHDASVGWHHHGARWLPAPTVSITCRGAGGCTRAGNNERPPPRPRRQHAVIENQVDARPRREGRQALEQFDRLEQQVRGPVAPASAQLQQHLPVPGEMNPLLRHRRPQRVPAQMLEPVATTLAWRSKPSSRPDRQPRQPPGPARAAPPARRAWPRRRPRGTTRGPTPAGSGSGAGS